jgi:aryl-alcohol dehydrogenase-like predicted oxidoreductase
MVLPMFCGRDARDSRVRSFDRVDASVEAATPHGACSVGERVEKRKLGNSDLSITPLGFGAWALGGANGKFGWGPQDDAESIAAIRRALERGVNWIDTAAAYGFGHSEEVVARALAGVSESERPYVFTKAGLVPDGKGGNLEVLDPASLRRECEASLRRLQVEAIDLYQIHWPTDRIEDIDAGWATLADLQREGKVRWIGVSNFNVEELQRAEAIAPITSLQPPYSLLRREIETDILPYVRAHNIGVIVYSPMQSGLLSGTMTSERAAALPASDWRSRSPEFQEPKLSANLALVERLRAIGAKHDASPGEVAIAWTLRNPAVTGAIVGARTPAQVDGWIGAAELRLSAGELAEIEGGVPA